MASKKATKRYRARRSVLYVPAGNSRAVEKSPSLACDAVIYDLEDAVAPSEKTAARENLRNHFSAYPRSRQERIIRINALSSPWGTEDFLAARRCRPDAILLPKVNNAAPIRQLTEALEQSDAPAEISIWAMIETPAGLLSAADIAQSDFERLECFVAGTNDLALETCASLAADRLYFLPWLMMIVAAARAGGLDVLDGVWNAFKQMDGFRNECSQARKMGFDGKTLIHPAQIDAANEIFSPTRDEILFARRVADAFDQPENREKNVISLDNTMVERLHLEMAERTLAKAAANEDAK